MGLKTLAILLMASIPTFAATQNGYLVKVDPTTAAGLSKRLAEQNVQLVPLGIENWMQVVVAETAAPKITKASLQQMPGILAVQNNSALGLLEDYRIHDPILRERALDFAKDATHDDYTYPNSDGKLVDKPEILNFPDRTGGNPLYSKQWGMNDIGADKAWGQVASMGQMIVGIIDTGADYNHEDLNENLWRNPGEMGLDAQGKDKSNNGIDDDGNGYIDDVIGWDFTKNDNKPFDMPATLNDMATKGGNPGHGTHCAGNVGARGDNGIGISGVAPQVKMMILKFITQEGQGTTADAVRAIKYAVDNGAKVLSNSWGSMGEDPADAAGNQALRDAIKYALSKNVLFVAAAGNGRQPKPNEPAVGYDNDSDANPSYPATYDIANIVSVAALDSSDRLGSFSNWGLKTVHLGAPGVKVFSTVVGNVYTDMVLDFGPGLSAEWDGTSMATPHVAGAAALFWAKHPGYSALQVKEALLKSTKPIPALSGKTVSGGKLNVEALLKL